MGNIPDGEQSLHIRLATAADRPKLIALINAAFSIEEFLEGTRTDEERLSEVMGQGEILMAEDAGGRLVGSVYLERRGKSGYLGMLAVDPASQGRGIGRMLTQTAEDRLRAEGLESVEIIVLNLREDLPPLYEKLGYRVTGTKDFKPSRKLKPGFQVHGIVMTKPL